MTKPLSQLYQNKTNFATNAIDPASFTPDVECNVAKALGVPRKTNIVMKRRKSSAKCKAQNYNFFQEDRRTASTNPPPSTAKYNISQGHRSPPPRSSPMSQKLFVLSSVLMRDATVAVVPRSISAIFSCTLPSCLTRRDFFSRAVFASVICIRRGRHLLWRWHLRLNPIFSNSINKGLDLAVVLSGSSPVHRGYTLGCGLGAELLAHSSRRCHRSCCVVPSRCVRPRNGPPQIRLVRVHP